MNTTLLSLLPAVLLFSGCVGRRQPVASFSAARSMMTQPMTINQALTISWPIEAGKIYELQEANAIGSPWTSVYGPGVNSTFQITNPKAQGFFRLIESTFFDWPEGAVVEQSSLMNDTNRIWLDAALLQAQKRLQMFSAHFDFATLSRVTVPTNWNLLGTNIETESWSVLHAYLNGQHGRAPSHLHIRLTEDNLDWLVNTVRNVAPSNRLNYLFLDGCNTSSNLVDSLLPIGISTREDLQRTGTRPFVVFYWSGRDFTQGMDRELSDFMEFFYQAIWQEDVFGYPCFPIDRQLSLIRARYPEIMETLRVAGSYIGVRIDEVILSDLLFPPPQPVPLWQPIP